MGLSSSDVSALQDGPNLLQAHLCYYTARSTLRHTARLRRPVSLGWSALRERSSCPSTTVGNSRLPCPGVLPVAR